MKKDKKCTFILFFILVLFLSVSLTESLFAYGKDRRDTGTTKTTKKSDIIKKYTRAELEEFFSGLPDGIRELVINKQTDKLRTPAQLNLIREIFLQAEKFRNESDEAYWQSYEDIAVLLDKTGQNAEMVLAFVSGGTSTFVTGTLFGATRAGVSEYSKGKSTEEILQAIAVAVAVDNLMKIKGLKNLGDRGGELVDMVSRASKLNKNPKVLKYLLKVGLKAGIYKQGESYTKAQIGNILNYIAKQSNNAQVQTSRSANIYTNQAGIR